MSLQSSITISSPITTEPAIVTASGTPSLLTPHTNSTTTQTPIPLLPPGTIAGVAIAGIFAGAFISLFVGCVVARLRTRKARKHRALHAAQPPDQHEGEPEGKAGGSMTAEGAVYESLQPYWTKYPRMQEESAGARLDPATLGLAVSEAPHHVSPASVPGTSASVKAKLLPPRPLDEAVVAAGPGVQRGLGRFRRDSSWTLFDEDRSPGDAARPSATTGSSQVYRAGAETSSLRPRGGESVPALLLPLPRGRRERGREGAGVGRVGVLHGGLGCQESGGNDDEAGSGVESSPTPSSDTDSEAARTRRRSTPSYLPTYYTRPLPSPPTTLHTPNMPQNQITSSPGMTRASTASTATSFESIRTQLTPPAHDIPTTPLPADPTASPLAALRYPKVPRPANQAVPRHFFPTTACRALGGGGGEMAEVKGRKTEEGEGGGVVAADTNKLLLETEGRRDSGRDSGVEVVGREELRPG